MKRTGIWTGVFIIAALCFLPGSIVSAVAADPTADPRTREMNSRLPPYLTDNDREENAFAELYLLRFRFYHKQAGTEDRISIPDTSLCAISRSCR